MHVLGAGADVRIPALEVAADPFVLLVVPCGVVGSAHEHPIIELAANERASQAVHGFHHILGHVRCGHRESNSEDRCRGRDHFSPKLLPSGLVHWEVLVLAIVGKQLCSAQKVGPLEASDHAGNNHICLHFVADRPSALSIIEVTIVVGANRAAHAYVKPRHDRVRLESCLVHLGSYFGCCGDTSINAASSLAHLSRRKHVQALIRSCVEMIPFAVLDLALLIGFDDIVRGREGHEDLVSDTFLPRVLIYFELKHGQVAWLFSILSDVVAVVDTFSLHGHREVIADPVI